ncbi:premelanosome protein a isoform X3 [Sphaeramia orbicularis]|uniref:premelanosome protein a isoform X3 n=1 Tax=Sphaeramia orbicularis TaxID=375764 RepID=UPI001181169B|nr:melanocyte protein PMEL-like isoform X3 [Sphaeramia orbicularis]
MKTLTLVLLVWTFTSATAKPRSQFTRYRSWNSRMYPVWKDGDPRFRNCWTGGEVTFDLKNDAPTLTGARATFNINLNFPPNQTVLSDGQVVWAQNCTVNGQQYQAGQAVYPDQGPVGTGVFPDGTPLRARSQDRKPRYVFVWKTWGRYWQVSDGPSSSLTIATDNVALGSYNMEVVIYHCRGQDKFIPLGYASTVFTITDQVPFTVSLAQVNDVNQDDQSFIQNRAIAFNVKLHDPSQYLSSADISFSWDFGDNTGTLISRERTVTHTYLSLGTFKPQVVLMASIPNGCGNPTAAPGVVVITPAAAVPADEGDVPASDATAIDAAVQPAEEATITEDGAVVVNTDTEGAEVAPVAPAAAELDVVAEETDAAAGEAAVAPAADETAAAAAETAAVADENAVAADETVVAADETAVAADETAAAADETAAVADETAAVAEGEEAVEAVVTVVPVAVEEPADAIDAAVDTAEADAAAAEPAADTVDAADAVAEVAETEAEVPADNVVAAATEATPVEEAAPAEAAAETEDEVLETENVVAATAAAAEQPAEGEVQAEVEAEPAQVALVIAKRQAPELTADCMVYRYGSLATSLDIIQGIESVEIVQMSNVVSMATELDQNAVDVTISCQGSLPSEVCTVISDADCITPVETVCNVATPSPDCQMILRQFFNDTGVFCINVSLTNDVSLAMASARVNVALASGGSPAGTAATVLGVMVLACVVCCISLMYRRFKQYQPLTEDNSFSNGGSSSVTSVPLLLWNLLSRQSPGESRPLLQGRIV